MKTKKEKVILTLHARERLKERTSILEDELCDLLDAKKCVITGMESCTNRIHELFYSKGDDDFFVAVRDTRYNEVITVLPLDYHENLAWEIKDKHKKAAMRLVGCGAKPHSNQGDIRSVSEKCSVSAILNSGARISICTCRTKKLDTVEQVMAQTEIMEKIFNGFARRGVTVADIEEVEFYCQDCLVIIPWDILDDFVNNGGTEGFSGGLGSGEETLTEEDKK